MLWNPNNPEVGQNLYRRNGKWRLRFSGHELKIPFIRGIEHSIEHEFPTDLVDLLEEWLEKWRPLLIQNRQGASHASKNGQEFVFLTRVGGPLYPNRINEAVQGATYKFTGVAVNVHMIRTIWATEYIKATRNVIDAAFMLGDMVETVLRSYAKLLDEECGKRASEWMIKTLEKE
jgi:integrase